ncbi:hypothetical protein [Pirellula sp. SH-Sr6A]|uniref:hypothetical protein n=1 Tax=Pirellula sp. SH-Sr6A TaxID=1632865 RepID=UPI0011BAC35F|nr:hypothetical protein [Pirellula sp. SH-Sr6A]
MLHLLLSILTIGLWLICWLLACIKIGGWQCPNCGGKKLDPGPSPTLNFKNLSRTSGTVRPLDGLAVITRSQAPSLDEVEINDGEREKAIWLFGALTGFLLVASLTSRFLGAAENEQTIKNSAPEITQTSSIENKRISPISHLVESSPNTTCQLDKIGAWIVSKKFVLQQIKSPATAVFQNAKADLLVVALEDCSYLVESYLDSENGFGAKVRTSFTVLVEYDPVSERWTHQKTTFRH